MNPENENERHSYIEITEWSPAVSESSTLAPEEYSCGEHTAEAASLNNQSCTASYDSVSIPSETMTDTGKENYENSRQYEGYTEPVTCNQHTRNVNSNKGMFVIRSASRYSESNICSYEIQNMMNTLSANKRRFSI